MTNLIININEETGLRTTLITNKDGKPESIDGGAEDYKSSDVILQTKHHNCYNIMNGQEKHISYIVTKFINGIWKAEFLQNNKMVTFKKDYKTENGLMGALLKHFGNEVLNG